MDDDLLTLRGTVHGSRIDLAAAPLQFDGAEVEVVIRRAPVMDDSERRRRNRELGIAEWWTEEDDRILAEIQKEREGNFGRELPE